SQQKHGPGAYTVWNLTVRQPRFTAQSGQVDRSDFETRAPLLDYDLVDFFEGVPYKYRFAQRMYKRAIATYYPEAARFPWSQTGGPIPGTPAAILGQFYLRGARRRLGRFVPARARAAERVHTTDELSEEMRGDGRFWS